MSSTVLSPSTTLQASSKGLKLYLTVDTNLNDDVRIIHINTEMESSHMMLPTPDSRCVIEQ